MPYLLSAASFSSVGAFVFGLGFFEILVIAVAALVFFGPKKLPEVMKQAGKMFVQLRRTVNDVKGTFDGVIRDAEDELRREEAETIRQLYAASAAKTKAEPPEDDGHNPDGTLKADYVVSHAQDHQPEGHHDEPHAVVDPHQPAESTPTGSVATNQGSPGTKHG